MNSLQEIERTTVTVQYVNPPKPGKKSGTIKSIDGQMFGVWPDKLGDFEPGETYEIDFTEKAVGGITYRDVKAVRPAATRTSQRRQAATAASPPPAQTNGHAAPQHGGSGGQYYRPTAPVDAERMWTCGLLQAFIKTGRLDLNEDMLTQATNILRSTWQATFGANREG